MVSKRFLLLGQQSGFGGKPLDFQAVCPPTRDCSPKRLKTGFGLIPRVKAYQVRSMWPLEPQSRFGGKLLENWVVCPQNRTAVLKGLHQDKATAANKEGSTTLSHTCLFSGDLPTTAVYSYVRWFHDDAWYAFSCLRCTMCCSRYDVQYFFFFFVNTPAGW